MSEARERERSGRQQVTSLSTASCLECALRRSAATRHAPFTFRVSRLGFRGSGFGFRVGGASDFEAPPSFGFRGSDFDLGLECLRRRGRCYLLVVLGLAFSASETRPVNASETQSVKSGMSGPSRPLLSARGSGVSIHSSGFRV